MLGELNQEHLKKTAVALNIPVDFVRKDFFVTKALYLLLNIQDEYFDLVFQGGTSLSKAYRLIQRFSEDIDFRVVLKPKAQTLGKDAKRKRLRDFRHKIIDALKEDGFLIPEQAVKVFYEGRFMSIKAEFTETDFVSYLKPHIAIECFVGELVLMPESKSISTLIQHTLSNESNHINFTGSCVALDETAAEKWVALTRRIANATMKPRQSDIHLVRHLYDLYHLQTNSLLNGRYKTIVPIILKKDAVQFKKHNAQYSEDPVQASKHALDELFENPKWREHWDHFLEQMVYEKNKPTFDQAYSQLQTMSQDIFQAV